MNKLIPYLKNAKGLSGYKIWVEFEDGINGTIDLNKWKEKKILSFWKDEKRFKDFEITVDKKIKWNEDIDMNPDAFYLQLIKTVNQQFN